MASSDAGNLARRMQWKCRPPSLVHRRQGRLQQHEEGDGEGAEESRAANGVADGSAGLGDGGGGGRGGGGGDGAGCHGGRHEGRGVVVGNDGAGGEGGRWGRGGGGGRGGDGGGGGGGGAGDGARGRARGRSGRQSRDLRELDGLGGAGGAADHEGVRELEGGWGGVELELEAVGGEAAGVGGDGPVEFAQGALDTGWVLLVGVRLMSRWSWLTCNGGSELESGVAGALEEEDGDGTGGLRGSPFDGVGRAWDEDLAGGWGGDDVEAGDLSEDAGGGGQSQQAGLDE